MPKGLKECPVCHGKGEFVEDLNDVMRITTGPYVQKCLTCMGKGFIAARKMVELDENGKEVVRTFDRIPPATPDSVGLRPTTPPQMDSRLRGNDRDGRGSNATAELTFRGPAVDILQLMQRYGFYDKEQAK